MNTKITLKNKQTKKNNGNQNTPGNDYDELVPILITFLQHNSALTG